MDPTHHSHHAVGTVRSLWPPAFLAAFGGYMGFVASRWPAGTDNRGDWLYLGVLAFPYALYQVLPFLPRRVTLKPAPDGAGLVVSAGWGLIGHHRTWRAADTAAVRLGWRDGLPGPTGHWLPYHYVALVPRHGEPHELARWAGMLRPSDEPPTGLVLLAEELARRLRLPIERDLPVPPPDAGEAPAAGVAQAPRDPAP